MQASTIIIAPRLRAPQGGLTLEGRDYRGGVFLPQSARPVLEALAVKAARVSMTDDLVIGINGFDYKVRSIPIATSVGTVAFLLMPMDKPTQSHHVHRDNSGEVACTCGDFIHRKANTGQMCKHGRRLAELGLIASTTPRVLPPFKDRPIPSAFPRVSPARPLDPFEMPTFPEPTPRNRYEPSPEDARLAAQLFACG